MKIPCGFTLIETLIILAVSAIILAIGVPGLSRIMANNQATAHANGLITTLAFSRSESVKRGLQVSICAKNDSINKTLTCGSESSDWSNGWFVFLDRNGNANAGYAPPEEDYLRSWPAQPGDYLMTAPISVGFNNSGAIQGNEEIVFAIKYNHCTGNQNRSITINTTGHASVTKEQCT